MSGVAADVRCRLTAPCETGGPFRKDLGVRLLPADEEELMRLRGAPDFIDETAEDDAAAQE
jgi:hypothetical protein